MSSIFETEQRLLEQRGGPSLHHSRNQDRIGRIIYHEKRGIPSKKVLAAIARRDEDVNFPNHIKKRVSRVRARAEAMLNGGYEGYDQETFSDDLVVLGDYGISSESIVN